MPSQTKYDKKVRNYRYFNNEQNLDLIASYKMPLNDRCKRIQMTTTELQLQAPDFGLAHIECVGVKPVSRHPTPYLGR